MTWASCLCVSHFHFISVTFCVYDPVFFNVILPEAPEFCFSFLTFASAHFDVSACVALFPIDANEDGWCLPARQDEAWNIPDTDAAILDWAGTSCAQVLPPLQVPLVFFHQNKRHSKQIKLPTPESIPTGRQHLWSWLVWYSTNIFCRAIATRHNRKNTAVSPQWHISVEPVSVYQRGLLFIWMHPLQQKCLQLFSLLKHQPPGTVRLQVLFNASIN